MSPLVLQGREMCDRCEESSSVHLQRPSSPSQGPPDDHIVDKEAFNDGLLIFTYRDENTTGAEFDVAEDGVPDLDVAPGVFSETGEVAVDEDVWPESVLSYFFLAFFFKPGVEIVQRWLGKKEVWVSVSIQWAIFRLFQGCKRHWAIPEGSSGRSLGMLNETHPTLFVLKDHVRNPPTGGVSKVDAVAVLAPHLCTY